MRNNFLNVCVYIAVLGNDNEIVYTFEKEFVYALLKDVTTQNNCSSPEPFVIKKLNSVIEFSYGTNKWIFSFSLHYGEEWGIENSILHRIIQNFKEKEGPIKGFRE